MSSDKKEKVIHIDKLVIHAKNVVIIHDQKENEFPMRDPWGFFGGRPRPRGVEKDSNTKEVQAESNESG